MTELALKLSNTPEAGGALVQLEMQRAIGEVQARALIARASPRNAMRALDAILQDCQDLALAEDAQFQYVRAGTDVRGASIRLVEAIASRWTNIAAGIRELARRDGFSEVAAYAWDLENNTFEERTFCVRHWRDTRQGGHAVSDERDLAEIIAGAGQRRKRSCLEALIPRRIIAAALAECDKTLRAKADVSAAAVAKMLELFAELGVSRGQLEIRLQRRVEAIQPAQMVGLRRVFVSLRDGMSVVSDWFEPIAPPAGSPIDAETGEIGVPAPTPAPPPPSSRARARRTPKPGKLEAAGEALAQAEAGAGTSELASDDQSQARKVLLEEVLHARDAGTLDDLRGQADVLDARGRRTVIAAIEAREGELDANREPRPA